MKTENYRGHDIVIEYDDMPENPRGFGDNFGKMLCTKNNRYTFGDEQLSVEEIYERIKKKNVVSLPLYIYDHSGVSMSTRFEYPYNDRWDSAQMGYIMVTYKDICKNYKKRKITPELIEQAKQLMRSEVKTYDAWLRGEVYGYKVDSIDESCWGYYDEDDALKDAKSCIDYAIKTEKGIIPQIMATA